MARQGVPIAEYHAQIHSLVSWYSSDAGLLVCMGRSNHCMQRMHLLDATPWHVIAQAVDAVAGPLRRPVALCAWRTRCKADFDAVGIIRVPVIRLLLLLLLLLPRLPHILVWEALANQASNAEDFGTLL